MSPSSLPRTVTLWCFLLLSTLLTSPGTASELSLVLSEPKSLEITPNIVVGESPGLKPGTKVKCARVHIHGLSRIEHWKRFANSVKVKVSDENPKGRPPNVQVCLHRNTSLGIGMCPMDKWEKLTDGLWVKSMSPFYNEILDIRMGMSYSEELQVFLGEEFFWYRAVFLVLGILFLCLASFLSQSLAFYYSSAMSLGVLLLILIVLFQGMKVLPTGRKSSLGIFIYSCFVGVGSFLLRYIPRLFKSLLIEIGLPEDIYDPVALFLLAFLAVSGAGLGFWAVRKLVLTEDGSIDSYTSNFVAWSIRIIASLLILQSSVDPLLAAEALIGGIIISSSMNISIHSNALTRAYRYLIRAEIRGRQSLPSNQSTASRPVVPVPTETFYSTYHETPNRRKFTKEEWDDFTKGSTRRALEELVSSPDFSKWAVCNADRITLIPKNETRKRWFSWY